MLMPLYGFLEYDTVGLLILAHETDTVGDLSGKLLQAARVRVPTKKNAAVLYKGATLDPQLTLSAAGLAPLDRFDVVQGE